jgi:hypothetical protein
MSSTNTAPVHVGLLAETDPRESVALTCASAAYRRGAPTNLEVIDADRRGRDVPSSQWPDRTAAVQPKPVESRRKP